MLLYKRAGGWLAPTRRTKIKSNYLNNRDILKEIHASKITYCSFDQPEHAHYDIILNSLDQINAAIIEQVKQNRADRLAREAYDAAQSSGIKVKIDEFAVDPATIPDTELVFRIMTWEHVPLAPSKAAVVEEDDEPLTEYDIDVVEPIKAPAKYVKVNFPPFFHYKLDAEGKTYIVGKSHWKGGLNDGQFSKDHGKFTNKLALMFMKLCERYATRSNWRGYTYNDEMRSQALLQLSQIGLQFDESKSSNPFAYYTAAITNSFTRVLNIEKRNQGIRDDILEMNNFNPSYTRQNDWHNDHD